MRFIVAVDTGGTFTDGLAVSEDGRLFYAKHPTTYKDLSEGVLKCLEEISRQVGLSLEEFLSNSIVSHGTTIASNTLWTRTGPKTGLITTRGFEDAVIMMRGMGRVAGLSEFEFKRQARARKPQPLVPRRLIKGVRERIDYAGRILAPLREDEVKRVVDELLREGVRSVAICTLFSPINPVHEAFLEEYLRRNHPDIYVSTSHKVAPEVGEYARAMTTVIDAYVGPMTKSYIEGLDRKLKSLGARSELLIMGVHGGVVPARAVRSVETVESGPAAGVIGAAYMAKLLGLRNVIATDVGGTTFKVAVIHEGRWHYSREPIFERFHVALPMVDVFSISAGGGTIVWVDPVTGLMKLGPRSAGSDPGPVCYDWGGEEPTVTDVDVILGYINPDYFWGGRMKLNKEKALKVFKEKVADPLGMDVIEAASAAFKIMNSQCADAIRVNTVMRGYDPKDFVVFAYGGAGPLHAPGYSRELGIDEVYVLNVAPVFCSLGMVVSDIRRVYKRPFLRLMPVDPAELTKVFEELEEEALRDMESMGVEREHIKLTRALEMRYSKQIHVETVPVKPGRLAEADVAELMDSFDRIYEETYGKGTAYRKAGMESVTAVVEAVYETVKPSFKPAPREPPDPSRAFKGTREAYWEELGGFVETKVYDGERLRHGNVVEGPAIIEYPATTAIVFPGQRAHVDQYLNLVVEVM